MSQIQKNPLYGCLDALFKGTKKSINLKETGLRWFMLVLLCLPCFGHLFLMGIIQVMQTPLLTYFNIENLEFNLLFTSYNVPATFTPLLGGILIDKFGIRRIYQMFSTIVVIGCFVTALGIGNKDFTLTLIGRAIMGLTAECVYIANAYMVSRWFTDKELALGMGAFHSFSRIAVSASSDLGPLWYKNTGDIALPFWWSLVFCLISFGSVTLLNIIDWYAQHTEAVHEEEKERLVAEQGGEASPKKSGNAGFKWANMKKFTLMFYMLVFIFTCGDVLLLNFLYNTSDFLIKRYGYSQEQAGFEVSIGFFMAIFLSPLLGILADKKGKRGHFLLGGFLIITGCHLYFTLLPDGTQGHPTSQAIYGMIGFGFFISMLPLIVPCIDLVMDKNIKGLGFGFMCSLETALVTVVSVLSGWIHDHTIEKDYGYYWTEIFYLIVSIAGALLSFVVIFMDIKTGSRLAMKQAKFRGNKDKIAQEDSTSGSVLPISDDSDLKMDGVTDVGNTVSSNSDYQAL